MSGGVHWHEPFPIEHLDTVVVRWERAQAAGECCSPGPLDDAFDEVLAWDLAWLDRLRRFGIEVAAAAEQAIARAREAEADEGHPS